MTDYAILVNIGLLSGTATACLNARRRGLNILQVVDAILVTALAGLFGARAVYVGANWAYYSAYPHQVLHLSNGGLAWHGGLVGGLTAVLIYCAIRRTSPRLMLDILTSGAAVLAAFAWLGCLRAGCAYGVETYPGQGILWALSLELPDLYGIRAPRVAVQLLGAGWSVVVLAAVVALERCERRAGFEGLAFPLWLALYCTGSFGLGFLRADEAPTIAAWRADQVADLALAVIGAALLLEETLRQKNEQEEAQRD